MRPLRAIAAALVAAASVLPAGHGLAQSLACPPPSKAMVRAELLFGRNIGGRPGVSEAAFARFIAREVTPRFPAGLTVIDALGQWRDAGNGRIVRERSKMVVLIADDGAETRTRFDAIAAAYKKQFRQQSVGILTRPVCASF